MTSTRRLPPARISFYDWQRHAACRTVDSSVFFGPAGERGRSRQQREQRAKTICADCPVQQACLQHALAVAEPYGVWGGLTEQERRNGNVPGSEPQPAPGRG